MYLTNAEITAAEARKSDLMAKKAKPWLQLVSSEHCCSSSSRNPSAHRLGIKRYFCYNSKNLNLILHMICILRGDILESRDENIFPKDNTNSR
uniref:Uncharacterized protein n=1 Tax=Oryza punctata TaxID=4537 RepID=A0A0E0JXX3_ORYPU